MPLLTPAILTNFRSLADKSLKIELTTQEHSPDILSQLSGLHQQYVNVYISEGSIDTEAKEILDTEKVDISQVKKPRTPSQRLRYSLHLLWEQENKGEPFDEFYAKRMELLIEQIQDRIE